MASSNRLSPIPHPPTKPVVGNMLSLDAAAPVQDLVRLTKELGPIFWLDMMGAPLVIVSGHDLVDELSDEKRFDKAVRGSLRRVRAVGGDGLFTADTSEPNWSKAHNILLQPFGNRAMQSYHPSMVDIAEQLVKKWERLNGDEEIDVVHDMTALTLDTIGLCGFDYRFNSFYRRDYHPFVESLVRSLETIMMTRGLPLEGLWLQKRRRDLAQDVAFMNKMVDEIIAERRGNAAAAEGKKDMLGAMMTGVDRATGEQLDDVNIRYQINTFLIAGHETTSGLLSCTLYALLKHPDVLKKAYEEVDRVLGPDTDARPTYQQVTQLTYITQILKEALRLWPPAPAYGIAPLKDETIGGKYKLKKNTFVTVLVMALHRDPSVWGPNPDAFDPENFSREAEAKRPINAWKPFGNGQRACIGRGFAMHEAALAIGMILQRFKLMDIHRYQMQLKETLTIKPDGFKIKVRPRDRERARRLRRPRCGGGRSLEHGGSAGPHASRPQHAVVRALRLQPRHRGRAGHPRGRSRRGQWLRDKAGADGRVRRQAAGQGRRADLLRLLQWRRTRQRHAIRQMAGQRPAQGCVRKSPLRRVRLRQQRLGGDLSVGAAHDRRAIGGAWRAQRLCARRGRCPQRPRRPVREMVCRRGCPRPTKEFGLASSITRSADDAPLYTIEPVAPTAVNTIVAQGGVSPMKVQLNSELQNKAGANPSDRSTRHIEVQLPPGISYRVGDHLSVVPRNDPALVDSVARRFGFLPADQIRLAVAEGRRAQLPVGDTVSVGRLLTEFVELQQIATRKQIQIMSEHTRCPVTKPKLLAYVGDDAASTERYRNEVLAKRKSVFDLLEEYPACELPFHAYLEMLSLLAPRYYSISSSPAGDASRCSVTVGVVEAPASSGRGVYKGVCSNYLAGRRAGDTIHATVRETKAGFRLPDDPVRADHHDRTGHGTGAVPRLPAGARRPQGQGRELGSGDAVLRLPPSRAGLSLRGRIERVRRRRRHRTAHRVLTRRRTEDLCPAPGRSAKGSGLEPDRQGRDRLCLRRRRQDGAGRQGSPGVDLSRKAPAADEAAGLRWIDDLGTRNRYVLDVWAGG